MDAVRNENDLSRLEHILLSANDVFNTSVGEPVSTPVPSVGRLTESKRVIEQLPEPDSTEKLINADTIAERFRRLALRMNAPSSRPPTFIEKEHLKIEEQLCKRDAQQTDIFYMFEEQCINHFWMKQDLLFYFKEYNHMAVCDHSEDIDPLRRLTKEDKILAMDAVAGDMLDAMDVVFDLMTLPWENKEDVGRMVTELIQEQNSNYLSCNTHNGNIFRRCNEKKFCDFPSSYVSNDEVIDLIEHVLNIENKMTETNFMDQNIYMDPTKTQLQLKDVRESTFYQIRNMMAGRNLPQPREIQMLKRPYLSTKDRPYDDDILEEVARLLESDRIALAERPVVVEQKKPKKKEEKKNKNSKKR